MISVPILRSGEAYYSKDTFELSDYATGDPTPAESVAFLVDNYPALYIWNLITLIAYSVLLVVAATTERDIVGVVRGTGVDADELSRTRLWVAAFALVTALVALRPPGGIVALTVLSGSLYAACFAPAILLGLWWRKGDGVAVLASIAVGVMVLLVWPRFPLATTIHQIFPAVIFSVGIYSLLSLRRDPVRGATLDRLFSG